MRRLSGLMRVRKSGMTGLVDRARDAGLIVRQPDPWVPETLRTLCDVRMLVGQFAEPVASSDVVDRGWGAAGVGP
jgi:hypothetical protein